MNCTGFQKADFLIVLLPRGYGTPFSRNMTLQELGILALSKGFSCCENKNISLSQLDFFQSLIFYHQKKLLFYKLPKEIKKPYMLSSRL